MTRRISIGSWAYTIGPYADNPVDFDTVCDQLAELGFDGVELGAFEPHPNPSNHPDPSQREDLAARVRGKGLEFSGIAPDLWGQKLINTSDQSDYVQAFRDASAFCTDLGIRGVRVDCTQPPTILDEVDYATALERVTSTWKTCCDIAADAGQYVMWEFEPGFAFNKPSDVVRVHDAVDKENFGLQYDTCHGQMVAVNGTRHYGEKEILPGGQVELIEMLTGRINHIHLIDSDNACHKGADGKDETSSHPPFGDGVLDFDELVPLLAKEDLDHDWWTIDLCFWPNAWDATAKCKKAIDALNEKYG